MFHRPNPKSDASEAPKQAEAQTAAGPAASEQQKQAPAAAPQERAAEPVKTQGFNTNNKGTEKEKQPMSSYQNNEDASKNETAAAAAPAQTHRPLDIPGSTFQRPGAAVPGRMPGAAYPGAYNPSSYGQPGVSAAADSSLNGRKLIVGEGISLSGEIEACDTLIVEGKVEAALKGASVLDIAETGVYYGTVEIDEATIAGRFEGDLTVNGRLTIRSTGSITGAIAYKELAVEAGATVDGKMNPLKGKAADGKKSESKGRDGGRKDSRDSARDENQLPFADRTVAAAE